jgi:hypothetical protein
VQGRRKESLVRSTIAPYTVSFGFACYNKRALLSTYVIALDIVLNTKIIGIYETENSCI